MRHPRSLSRVLTHPPEGRVRTPRKPPGDPSRAPMAPPGSGSSPDPAPGDPALRDERAEGARVLFVTAGVAGAIGLAIGLLTGFVAGPRLVLAGALLGVTGVLVRRPDVADRLLAALVGMLLLPVLLCIGLAVALTSPGPVLVRELHADRTGRPLPALRFRTTVAVDEADPATVVDAPPTALGRVLRPLGLDELPRLMDVVWGDVPLLRAARH